MRDANYLGADTRTVLEAVLGDDGDPVTVVNPSPETARSTFEVLRDLDRPPALDLLATEATVKAVVEDFLVASHAADLVEDGTLTIRTDEELPVSSLVVTPTSVVALVVAGEQVAGLGSTDEDVVSSTRDHFETLWRDAEEFDLRTPALSRVRATLERDFSEGVATDFDAVLDSVSSTRNDGLDEVAISLLVAARNGELLYDISKWGEDIGLASKATFSRTKTELEENGLLDTEKVPIDVGRPRLRLMLGDSRLEEAPIDDLAAEAESLLR